MQLDENSRCDAENSRSQSTVIHWDDLRRLEARVARLEDVADRDALDVWLGEAKLSHDPARMQTDEPVGSVMDVGSTISTLSASVEMNMPVLPLPPVSDGGWWTDADACDPIWWFDSSCGICDACF